MRALAGILLALLLTGCPQPQGSGTPGPGAQAPLTKQEVTRVQIACSRCHRAPEPEVLPRARWAELIPTMISMPLPAGQAPLTEEELKLALRYYEQAPEALPRVPQAAALSDRLTFQREEFIPQRKEFTQTRAPAVSNLAFVHLNDARRLDLLICELRSQALFLLPAWAPAERRKVLHLAGGLGYPARVTPSDLDKDGQPDFLIAALGGMDPTNETKGGALWLRPDEKRRFKPQVLAPGLGRVTDVRPADLDGDGDLDLIVCAFGWRGPGQLVLLENQGGSPPRFAPPRVLDARDGYIHAIPHDLDGDGDLDVVAVIAQHYEQVVWLRNDGGLKLTPLQLYAAPHPAWGSSGLELHDLDGDGDQDLLVSNGDMLDDRLLKPYHGVGYLELTGVTKGEPQVVYRRIGEVYGCEAATAADLDGDGDLDVVCVAFAPQLDPAAWEGLDSVVWFERTPQGWTRHALEKGRPLHPCLAVGDYDADGKLDLAVGNYVWIGQGDRPTTQADFVTLFTRR
ncbi:MAG: FG-GAP repeat protein [Planctomycetota bacterium]